MVPHVYEIVVINYMEHEVYAQGYVEGTNSNFCPGTSRMYSRRVLHDPSVEQA